MRVTISIVDPDVINHIEELQRNKQNISGFFTMAALQAIHEEENKNQKTKDEIKEMIEAVLLEQGYKIPLSDATETTMVIDDDEKESDIDVDSNHNSNRRIKNFMNTMFADIEKN